MPFPTAEVPFDKDVPHKQGKLLSLDFDGVIHSYTSPWVAEDVARDPPVPGAAQFLYFASEVFRLQVYSSRSSSLAGRQCMRNYCISMMHEYFKTIFQGEQTTSHAFASSWVYQNIAFPTEKGPAFLSIDDRALTFDGTWPDLTTLHAFKPWNKK